MKKLKPYFYTGLACLGILILISILKGVFPFGDNSFVWGDMHDQITAFYYHLHDSVYGNNSLFINFSTSGGINFFGIIAYYILSPFSLLALLIPRSDIYLMVSVIIDLKLILCSITCLYFLRKTFKNMPALLSSLLAIIYAFSSYAIVMYQITPWIDAMYMFPLVVLGLKKVLDLEKPTLYVITLTLSLIFSFYVTVISLMFIFLLSFIYLLVYKEEKEIRKKAILSLGVSTVFAILISLFIVLPAYLQINESSRLGFNLSSLLNSRLGPITDKISLIMFGGLLYAALFGLLLNYKKHLKFLTFYIPALLIMLIPLIVEPVNKVFHFGSYACFPYRAGYVLMLLMVIGAGYYFDNYKERKTQTIEVNRIVTILITLLTSLIIVKLTLRFYDRFQAAIYKLSISFDGKLIIILIITTFLAFVASATILAINKNLSTFTLVSLLIIAISHITVNTYTYFGNDLHQEELTGQYKVLARIAKDYKKDEYYRVKNDIEMLLVNNGMVMKYHNLDHFTSLTNKSNLQTLKRLGYDSEWVKTFSSGSNVFFDAILGNKYLLTDKYLKNSNYRLIKNYSGIKLYELKDDIPYGVLVSKNDSLLDKNNSFEVANSLYKNITGSEEDIFAIDSKISLDNVKSRKLENGLIEYDIVDPDYYAYLEKDIIITGKKRLYLEINHTLDNNDNAKVNGVFNLYVNNQLVKEKAFSDIDNGTMDLGVFSNERVNIKLELTKKTVLKEVTAGAMDIDKYEDFIENNRIDTNIKFNRNKISLKVNGVKDKILLLPIPYNSGYKATNNGKNIEIIKLYDNFIGIKLNDGVNNIKLTYTPKGLLPGIIISVVSLITFIILVKTKLYNKLIDIGLLKKMTYGLYLFMYIAFIVIVYVGLTICFMLSYLVHL